jgi:hypothetical protein
MIDVGMHLKSDEVIDFLELYDLSVEYHFDRLHEGENDSYTVESDALSLDLRFDTDQRCNAIFIRDPGVALSKGLVSFPLLTSPTEIEAYAKVNALTLIKGASWLRCDGAARSLHYEFAGDELKMVTIMSRDAAPHAPAEPID